MNLGLLEGRAAGGPAGLTPAPTGATAPVPAIAESGSDPAFRMLMDLFAVPSASIAQAPSDATAVIDSPVFPWPCAPARVNVRHADAQPSRTPERPEADDDQDTVDGLLAGLFVCTEPAPANRQVVSVESPAAALPFAQSNDDKVENAATPSNGVFRPVAVAVQPEGARKIASPVEHSAASAGAESSPISEEMNIGEAFISDDHEQSDPETFNGDERKAPVTMPAPVRAERFDLDRNAAMPEFAPAGQAASARGGDVQLPPKAPFRAPASQIMFTPAFTHAVHAIAMSRLHAAPSMQESHMPASLPGTTAAQIVQTIQLAWTRHGGEARITLDPEQFGELSVAMRVDRGQVVARVQAETPQVREWLHANVDTLRAGLAEHHLRLDRIEIAALDDMQRESENREAGQQDGHEQSSHPRRSRRDRSNHVFELEA